MPASDGMELVAIAIGAAAIVVLLGLPLLRLLRGRVLAVQVSALALVLVVAIALGVLAAAEAMFIAGHDLVVVEVVLVAVATVGIAAAILLGGRVAATSSSLVAVTRRIGDDSRFPLDPEVTADPREISGPPELVRLAHELELMEQRLADARRREQAVEESRRELVAWVSHDLRTPLAAIRAMVEALEDGVVSDPATVARFHANLRAETDRLAGLVDDLFELSRTQAGALRLQLEQVSLGDLVSDAIAGVAPVAAAKGVRLEGRVVGPSPAVQVSTPEVLRALRNVLENAIRHTPTDGSVMVLAGADEPGEAYVAILDSGGGVPLEDVERIFDVGYQSDPARTGGGAGLGLAIARGFVEAHQGRITVENENGGARFTVRLPREPAV
ncbi:MAG: HAMP domain-containing histidine kinase [Acidimicrobiia bacterium]|nr:HAMP domain-containing histidine kinase [Acidimicrobiia bacterium]